MLPLLAVLLGVLLLRPAVQAQGADARSALEDAQQRVASLEAGGEDPLELAAALMALANVHSERGDGEGVVRCAGRAAEIRERALGSDDPRTGFALLLYADGVVMTGALDEALSWYARALAAFEGSVGPDAAETADALHALGVCRRMRRETDAARALLERALAIREEVLGQQHPDTVNTVNSLAVLYHEQGDLEAARGLYERAVSTLESAEGGTSAPLYPDYVRNLGIALHDLGRSRVERGDRPGATPFFERALEHLDASGRPAPLARAGALNELAIAAQEKGDLRRARALFERALATLEADGAADSPIAGRVLLNLGGVLRELGDLDASADLDARALASLEAAHGEDHALVGTACHNLGGLVREKGDLEGARRLLERAIDIRTRVLGAEHPETASSYDSLGLLLSDLGDHDGARVLLERALAIREQAFGPESEEAAISYSNLSGLADALGDRAEMRRLRGRALELLERVLGPEHPRTATALANLARVLVDAGEPDHARALDERALGIYERVLGPGHPEAVLQRLEVADALQESGDAAGALALFEAALVAVREDPGAHTAHALQHLGHALADYGRAREAWALVRNHLERGRALVDLNLSSLSEADRFAYLSDHAGLLELLLALARRLDAPPIRRASYDAVLAWKGRIARHFTAGREQLARAVTDEQRALLAELRSREAELAQAAADPASFDARRAEAERVERELLSTLSAYELRDLDHDRLRAALDPSTTLVDLVEHQAYEPGADGAPGRELGRRVSAWVVRADLDAPAWIDLGSTDEVRGAVGAHLAALRGAEGPDRGLAASLEGGATARPGAPAGETLHERVWDPLAPYVTEGGTVLVAADGALATLPFETLPLADGTLALEHHAFVYLPDATFAARAGHPATDLDSLLAVGGVDFGARAGGSAEHASGGSRGSAGLARSLGAWPALPATGEESRSIVELFALAREDGRRLLLQGSEPTEERVRAELGRFSVVHLATHGYFQPDALPSAWSSARDGGELHAAAARLAGRRPGLLSGLVLAGAELGDARGRDDGYLTAEEVGWLDLTGVELVVLSACETGLGRPQAGEGLVGLRRAFHTAGAATVISSLWAVDDESTAVLMLELYENLLVRRRAPAQALRAAQLALLERNRAERGDPLPRTWGAFVLSGAWR